MWFENYFLPEVQYPYGFETDSWGHPTVALLQHARNKVFAEFQETLTTKSPVFWNARRESCFLFVLANRELRTKWSLSFWHRTLLKLKAEKVIKNYFADEGRFSTDTDIVHQPFFLLGDGKVVSSLFQNGTDVMRVEDVRTSINASAFPPTRTAVVEWLRPIN